MRTDLCLRAFDNYKNIKKEEIPSTYFNKFYNKYLDLTVADFYWACSRKSYLPCGQICDIYSYDSIKLCLLAGARLINLEICFNVIKKYGWLSGLKYPLILYLNLNTNNRLVLHNLSKILNKVFDGY